MRGNNYTKKGERMEEKHEAKLKHKGRSISKVLEKNK
jgi:hypothetical protein